MRKGQKASKEAVQKMKIAHTNKHPSEETKQKISATLKGRRCPNEARIKISNTLKGRKIPEEVKKRMSIAHAGMHPSKECTKKSSELRKGVKYSKERLKKMSRLSTGNTNWLGKRHSEASKKRMSKSRLEGLASGHIKPNERYYDTIIELAIEQELINNGVTYKKQEYIEEVGIVDFFLPGLSLIVECDGDYWHNLKGAKGRDRERDLNAMNKHGYKTIRLWEHEIHESTSDCFKAIIVKGKGWL